MRVMNCVGAIESRMIFDDGDEGCWRAAVSVGQSVHGIWGL